jgi:hypothetical protein
MEEAMSSKKKLTLSVDERVIERARRYSTRTQHEHFPAGDQVPQPAGRPLRQHAGALGSKASRNPPERYLRGGLPTASGREALLMRLFLDINVVLDVLADREPWVEHSAAVLSLLDAAEVEGLIAAHSVTTLYYLSARHLGHKRAVAALIDLWNTSP